jgi:sulfate transport system ATP-binding protein
MPLVIEAITKELGRHPALAGVSLEVRDGEFLALLGPSGAGKTTLLRLLAGLERPDAGAVRLNGANFLELSAGERRVGLVFQHYALFRHLDVARNIAFALEVRPRSSRPSRAAIRARVDELLALTRIEPLVCRYPAQLSGGEAQRVAVARALAADPQLLLLDEPFGALDAKVRHDLRAELRRIHDATGITTLLVTHDQEEAMVLADRVAVMNAGRIEQVGTPEALEAAPASPFVFAFLGEVNRLPCEASNGEVRFAGFQARDISVAAQSGRGTGLFRPTDTLLSPHSDGLPVRILAVAQRGPMRRFECETEDGVRLAAEIPEHLAARFTPGGLAHLSALRAVAEAA